MSSKRSLSVVTLTPTAVADTADMVDNTYHGFIQGGSASQRIVVSEVMLTGQAPSTSSVNIMLFSRDSQVGTGAASKGAGVNDSGLDGNATVAATIALVGNQFATLKPRRDAANHLWNLSINTFGGVLKYVPPAGGEITIFGQTQPVGECSLSAFTGGTPGLLGSHIIYEIL